MEASPVSLTKQWIERFVIGLRLCPFAHYSFYGDTIYYELSKAKKEKSQLMDLMRVTNLILNTSTDQISNAFVILDAPISFLATLQLKEQLDQGLAVQGKDQDIQTVVFHPEFQFADEDYHAAGNFTNRSPHPMIHILREAEVAHAIEATEDVENIPFRNKAVLEDIRIKHISEIFAEGFVERIRPYI